MILISATTILAKNVYQPMVPATSDRTVGGLARALVPVIALVAVVLTLRGGQAIVSLLLMGYNFVTQLFPGVVLSFGRRPRASTAGVFAGIAGGTLTVAYLSLAGSSVATIAPWAPQLVKDLNVGIVALAVNIVVLAAVSLVTRRRTAAADLDAAATALAS
jgi:SSS family solute:Na+ symporter